MKKMRPNSVLNLFLQRLFLLGMLLLLGTMAGLCQVGPKKAKPVVNQEERDAAYRQLFTTLFYKWDHNQDGKVDVREINSVIQDPSIHGNESAIAVVLRRHLLRENENQTNGLTLAEMLTMGGDPQMQKAVSGNAWHVAAINHALFLPNDPSLAVFHQGGMGDCYLLAVVGTFTYHHPELIRTMIQMQPDGKFDVHFGNGKKVLIEPITDSELILGAVEGRDHGIWLSVLEKAFAKARLDAKEEKTGLAADADEAVLSDLIGHGGYYAPVMAMFSGHKTASVPMGRWLKDDPAGGVVKMNELLTRLSTDHRVMAVCTGGDKTKTLPKGVPHGHVFGVLEYSPATHMVRVFNPWGNHFKPPGEPGLVHGYVTQHGIFDVPLAEFMKVFGGFTYETDKLAGR
ncbi:MAG: hypothetical protein JWR26_1441 [Pedosphaera sp.]|nr:hypothetical protein [Pedosphaera sp.]